MDKPESMQELLASITPEVYLKLRTAVELGKWENGERLSADQREHCMQAIIAYDQKLPEEERVAYIDRRKIKKTHCDD